MTAPIMRKQRCAIYTRKSSEEGLDMEFNSLDAQREACEAYIASQKSEGWVLHDGWYDDGGVSGATLDRSGLKSLIDDIEYGHIDVVVVYKIDRLSRSLMDFAKLVDVFDRHGVTFVSITQSFNTTTSMGRLTLNILLSFAQFEREVAGERIRDKIAASRRKGMWMGGNPPLGYDVKERKLVINKAEATTVRAIFERFLTIGSATALARDLMSEGVTTKRGKPMNKGYLYKLLGNRVYIGMAVHRGPGALARQHHRMKLLLGDPGQFAHVLERRCQVVRRSLVRVPFRQLDAPVQHGVDLALREELDTEYEARNGFVKPASTDQDQENLSNRNRT